jgi:hypothetical protein
MMIKLTDPDGSEVWIAPRWVTKVRRPITGRHSPNANALLVMGQSEQAVQEEVKKVLLLLEGVPNNDDDAAVRRAPPDPRPDPDLAAAQIVSRDGQDALAAATRGDARGRDRSKPT